MTPQVQRVMEQHTGLLNWSAVSVSILALLEYAPKIAALLSAIWLSIQIGSWAVKKVRALVAWWKARRG